jgi:hypothetical protein
VTGHYSNEQLSSMGVLEGQFISNTVGGFDGPETPNNNAPYKEMTVTEAVSSDVQQLHELMSTATGTVCALLSELACRLWMHYGNRSGADFVVDTAELAKDSDFASALNDQMSKLASTAGAQCQGGVGTTCTFTVDSQWRDGSFRSNKSLFLGIGNFKFRAQGTMSVTKGENGSSSVQADYTLGIYKQWNFDADKPVPGFEFMTLEPFARMPSVGVAQEFVMWGNATMTYRR